MKTSLTKEFPKVIIDQSAETRLELSKDWPLSAKSLENFIAKKVQSGEWERVKKRVGGVLKMAYRRAKA